MFYPDVFLYPLALMRMGGASQTYVMNVYYVAVNIVTAACMYVCAKRIFGNRWAGVFASILYLLADYRISNVFTRTAVGEMTAMAFMPLFVLGLWEVVLGDKRRWRVLTFGAASVFLCHLISTVLCAIVAAVSAWCISAASCGRAACSAWQGGAEHGAAVRLPACAVSHV